MGGKKTVTSLLFTGIFLISTMGLLHAGDAVDGQAGYKRVGGIQMPPAMKRGLELGWDKGYLAGKAEVEQTVDPDPTRFEDYNDPNKWYRYEFGQRSQFIRGFRGGFLKGYSYGLQQQVRYKAPIKPENGQYASSTDAAMGMDGAPGVAAFPAMQSPKAPAARAKSAQQKAKEKYNQVLSDAL